MDKFIIVDEAQSMRNEEIKSIITRLAEGSKMIFTGDESQPHPSAQNINHHHNGILFTRRALRGVSGAAQIPMDEDDIVRSSIIKEILENIRSGESDLFNNEDDDNYVTD